MRAFTIRLTAAVLMFIVGVSTAKLWLNHRDTLKATLAYFMQPQISFEYEALELVMIAGRGCVDVHIYKANDGTQVRMSADSFDSPDLAAAELERMIKGDVEIIERKAVAGEQGREAGERIVARRHFDRNKPAQIYIWKTEGGDLYRFSGTSLQHLLALESYLK